MATTIISFLIRRLLHRSHWTSIWQYLDKLRNISTHSMVVYWIVSGNHSSFDFSNYINFGVSLFFFFLAVLVLYPQFRLSLLWNVYWHNIVASISQYHHFCQDYCILCYQLYHEPMECYIIFSGETLSTSDK